MKKIITILMLLMMIGAAGAAWYPRSADYNTTGNVNAHDGTFTGDMTVTGVGTFSGGIYTNGLVVNGTKTLTVTDADKLTVGGVIVPQEIAIPFTYTASSVDIGVFSAKGAWNITGVELVPRVAGNDASAVNVTIKVCDSGEAPSSGDAALSAVLDLKGTADTTQSGTLGANVAVTATQYVALDFTGTLTNAVGMGTIWLKRV